MQSIDVARSTLPVAPQLKSLGVTIDSNLRFDCHARNVAKSCNFHTRALRHVHSLLTDDVAQTVASSIVASRLEPRLLQRPAVRHTVDDIRQTAMRPEQPGQSRLSLPGSLRRQAAAPVAPLASSETASHLQIFYKVPLLTHKVRTTPTWYRPTYQLGICDHPTLRCWLLPGHRLNSLDALSLLQRHLSGTLYLLTLDCARVFPHSSAT